MQIRQRDNALTGWIGDDAVAQLTWNINADGWYINYLNVTHWRYLLPMLVQFRTLWRERGKPVLYFESWSNPQAQRIPRLFNATQVNGVYRIDDLDMI